jgi:hypothetical protein
MGLISVASEKNARSMPLQAIVREWLVLPQSTLSALLNLILSLTLSNRKISEPVRIATCALVRRVVAEY